MPDSPVKTLLLYLNPHHPIIAAIVQMGRLRLRDLVTVPSQQDSSPMPVPPSTVEYDGIHPFYLTMNHTPAMQAGLRDQPLISP